LVDHCEVLPFRDGVLSFCDTRLGDFAEFSRRFPAEHPLLRVIGNLFRK
jgi:hypothetical protein